MKKKKLIFIILFLLILGLIAWSSFTHVSPIKGRVVDAESGKPMNEVNIRAKWVTGYVEPGGGSFRTFKVYATKTDGNGEFVLPRTMKLKIPIIEWFQGIGLLAYEHEYICQYFDWWEWRLGKKVKYYNVELKRIKDDEEFNKNLKKVKDRLLVDFDEKADPDLKFIIDDYKIFLEKYPYSKFFEENYWTLAIFYKKAKDYKSALMINEEFIKKFPNSQILSSIKEDIQTLKKLVRESPKIGGDNEK